MPPTPSQDAAHTIAHDLAHEPHRLIDAGPGSLAHWSFGEGPDLVFVHGWPLHAATWREIIPNLTDAFTCHVFDLPGVRFSPWEEGARVGLWPNALALARAITDLGLTDYTLIAHDSGATITRLVATLDRGNVRALVMGNTELSGHVPTSFVLGQKLTAAPGVPTALSVLAKSKRWRHSAAGFAGCFGDTAKIEGAFHDLFIEPLSSDPAYLEGQLRYVRGIEWGVLDDLPQIHALIDAPTLMIWGAGDRMFPLDLARKMMPEFAVAPTLHVIEDARLFVHEEFPEVFAAHTRQFLNTAAS